MSNLLYSDVKQPEQPYTVTTSLTSLSLLKTSENDRLQSLLKILPAGVVVINRMGLIEECNIAAEELLGEGISGKRWIDVIEQAFAPRQDDGAEISLKDGRRVSLSTRALEKEPGQIVLLTDLTETRALQERMNRQQHLADMGKMTASVAHQIRTPLSAALLYAENLINSDISAAQRDKFSSRIVNALKQLETKIQDMLVFAKGGNTIKADYNVAELLADLEHSLETQLEVSNTTLVIRNTVGCTRLHCNRDAILGALQNLINNSIQASGNGTAVCVTVMATDTGMLDLIVIDEGPGMSASIQKKICKPFFTTKEQGTGLGLAVVKAVAKAHYGDLWIKSAIDQGSMIGMRLPVDKNNELNIKHEEVRS